MTYYSGSAWLGGDTAARQRRSRLLVERHLVCEQAREGRCLHREDKIRCWVYPELEPREDLLPNLDVRAAEAKQPLEQAIRDCEDKPQRWHSDGLTAQQRALRVLMEGDHRNHGRKRQARSRAHRVHGDSGVQWREVGTDAWVKAQWLAAGGWQIDRRGHIPTGHDAGRPTRTRELTGYPSGELTLAVVREWMEAETGLSIDEITAATRRGTRGPHRDLVEEAARRSPASSTVLAFVIGCDRRTVNRWRALRVVPKTPTKSERAETAPPLFYPPSRTDHRDSERAVPDDEGDVAA